MNQLKVDKLIIRVPWWLFWLKPFIKHIKISIIEL